MKDSFRDFILKTRQFHHQNLDFLMVSPEFHQKKNWDLLIVHLWTIFQKKVRISPFFETLGDLTIDMMVDLTIKNDRFDGKFNSMFFAFVGMKMHDIYEDFMAEMVCFF